MHFFFFAYYRTNIRGFNDSWNLGIKREFNGILHARVHRLRACGYTYQDYISTDEQRAVKCFLYKKDKKIIPISVYFSFRERQYRWTYKCKNKWCIIPYSMAWPVIDITCWPICFCLSGRVTGAHERTPAATHLPQYKTFNIILFFSFFFSFTLSIQPTDNPINNI